MSPCMGFKHLCKKAGLHAKDYERECCFRYKYLQLSQGASGTGQLRKVLSNDRKIK